jgi:hypothetical protein
MKLVQLSCSQGSAVLVWRFQVARTCLMRPVGWVQHALVRHPNPRDIDIETRQAASDTLRRLALLRL